MEFQEKGARRRNIPDENKTRRQACPKKGFAASGRDFALDASENRKTILNLSFRAYSTSRYMLLNAFRTTLLLLNSPYFTTFKHACQTIYRYKNFSV